MYCLPLHFIMQVENWKDNCGQNIEPGLLNSTTLKNHALTQTVRRTVLVNVVEKGVS